MRRVRKSPKFDVSPGEIQATLKSTKTLLMQGHFVNRHKNHQRVWVDPEALTTYPTATDLFARAMKERWIYDDQPQIIVAAAPRATIIGHLLALHFSLHGPTVPSVYLTEGPNGYVFNKRYRQLVYGKIALICDDVIASGRTAKAMMNPVIEAGGHVLGVITIVNHGWVTPLELGVTKIVSLYRNDVEVHETPCPMCEDGMPINTDHGFGQTYLDEQSRLIGTLDG